MKALNPPSALSRAALIALALCACLPANMVVDVRVPEYAVSEDLAGAPVAFSQIRDRRIFRAAPVNPSLPSLAGGDTDDDDTARAIARESNAYGVPMGDVLLPEGRTVAMIIEEALTQGFDDAGHPVVKPGQPGYERAIPLEVDIDEFWAWSIAKPMVHQLQFRTALRIRGPLPPFEQGLSLRGRSRPTNVPWKDLLDPARSEIWRSEVREGLRDLLENLEAELAAARPSPSPASTPRE